MKASQVARQKLIIESFGKIFNSIKRTNEAPIDPTQRVDELGGQRAKKTRMSAKERYITLTDSDDLLHDGRAELKYRDDGDAEGGTYCLYMEKPYEVGGLTPFKYNDSLYVYVLKYNDGVQLKQLYPIN